MTSILRPGDDAGQAGGGAGGPGAPGRRGDLILAAVWLAACAATAALYPQLPDRVPIHWNVAGEPDRFGPRWQVAITLLLPVGIYALMGVLPRIDPQRRNYALFSGTYAFLRRLLVGFTTGVHVVVLLASADYPVRVERAMPVIAGILFALIGNVLGQVRHNYFVGIRTPWTLADEEVWRRTHRVGARLFVLLGVATAVAGIVDPRAAFAVIAGGSGLLVAGTLAYSYWVWRRIRTG